MPVRVVIALGGGGVYLREFGFVVLFALLGGGRGFRVLFLWFF